MVYIAVIVAVLVCALLCLKWYQAKPDKFYDLLSGHFHFKSTASASLLLQIKYALAQNKQDLLHVLLKKIPGATDVVAKKSKKISSDVITIGFFCSYYNAGMVRRTVGKYNAAFDKINWVICSIGDDHCIHGFSGPVMFFPNTDCAVQYANKFFDFVVDADSFLKEDNFYDVIKKTTSYTMNFFNLACSTYNNYFDIAFVPETVQLSKYKPAERIVVRVPNLGAWDLPEQKEFHEQYLYDIAFIGDQFKYGKRFFELYADFSQHYKIVFLGLRHQSYFKENLIKFDWDLKNIIFHDHIRDEKKFRYFLTKTKVVIDTPDYSGGSSNVYALRSGTPVLTLNGEYLVDGMISAVLKEMGLPELCFDHPDEMKQFIDSKKEEEFKKYRKYVLAKTSQSLQFQPKKFLPIFYDRLMQSLKEQNLIK